MAFVLDDPLPAIKEDAQGQLIVARAAFENPDVGRSMLGTEVMSALPAGALLELRLRQADVLTPGLGYRLLPVRLLEELLMARTGARKAQCFACRCEVVGDSIRADSLNQLLTMASQTYETRRRSHNGNVFTHFFFDDAGRWQPLDLMRARLFRTLFAGRNESDESSDSEE